MKLTSDIINKKVVNLISDNLDWGIMGGNGEFFAFYVNGIVDIAESLKKELNKSTEGEIS